jgi:hypothetical protein
MSLFMLSIQEGVFWLPGGPRHGQSPTPPHAASLFRSKSDKLQGVKNGGLLVCMSHPWTRISPLSLLNCTGYARCIRGLG